MERHNRPPPDDFPRLWGVEDKLGLYIPKQKGVLALEGELDISPRDIYLANLNPYIGSEQGGTRPVLLLQNNTGNFYCPTLIVAPLTARRGKKPHQPTHYLLSSVKGMDGASVILLEQIKTIDKRRVVRYIGRVSHEQMDGVNEALQISLGLYIPEEMEAP